MPGDDRHLTGDEPVATDLGQFWDEVVERAPARPLPTPALDPTLTTTIRRLHAADDAPGADAVFGKRLLEDLMHAHATTTATYADIDSDATPVASAGPLGL